MKCNFENCGYYTDGECNICGMGIDGEDTFCRLCKDNPNCYYKQNEKLKQDIEAYKQSEQEASEIIAELKAENEKLKKEIKNNKSAYEVELDTYNMECSNLLEENKELAHYLACMTEQRNKANTCLQEIKEIAEADVHIVGDEKLYYDSIEKILQVITKAESEEV